MNRFEAFILLISCILAISIGSSESNLITNIINNIQNHLRPPKPTLKPTPVSTTKPAPSCPPLVPVPNFNLNQYLGKWHLKAVYFPFQFPNTTRCMRTDIVQVDNQTYVQLQQGIGLLEGNAPIFINITDKILPDQPGLVIEQEYGLQPGYAAIIYTDYVNIAATYSCNIINNQVQEYSYILTRSRGFNNVSLMFSVLDKLQRVPVNLSKMQFNLINDLSISCPN